MNRRRISSYLWLATVLIAPLAMQASAKPPAKGGGRVERRKAIAKPARSMTAIRLNPHDPQPLVTRAYLDIEVRLRQGKLAVGKVRKGQFARSQGIRRFRGGYQLRLYAHRLLLDIIRFDFPLTARAGERTSANIKLDRSLAKGVSAQTTVRVPLEPRITRVVLLDPRLGRRVAIDLDKLGNIRGPAIEPKLDGPRRTSVFK